MELAIILILLVIFELVITVWLLARTIYGNRKYGTLEKYIGNVDARVTKLEFDAKDSVIDAPAKQSAIDTAQQQQAIDLLAKLGISVESQED